MVCGPIDVVMKSCETIYDSEHFLFDLHINLLYIPIGLLKVHTLALSCSS